VYNKIINLIVPPARDSENKEGSFVSPERDTENKEGSFAVAALRVLFD
jgi:hypothetical protein